jgi:hypothetical protein
MKSMPEDFFHTAILICHTYDPPLFAGGELKRCQRPHVTSNDLLLLKSDLKVLLGVFHSLLGMMEAVPLMGWIVFMPVIQKEIVKHCSSYQCVFIAMEMQAPVNQKAEFGHLQAVLEGRCASMLDKLFHLLYGGLLQQRSQLFFTDSHYLIFFHLLIRPPCNHLILIQAELFSGVC